MPPERVLASFIVRVVVRARRRLYSLQNVRSGETQTFSSGQALLEQLERAAPEASAGDTSARELEAER